MMLDEAVKKFAKDFSSIPTELIKKAYQDDPEKLICLNSEEYFEDRPLEYFPAMWGWMFKCDDWTDEEWIKENISEVEKIGFIIYECEYCGILLGLNSCGHDFYEAYWQPLYLSRGLQWHEKEKAAAKS